MQKTELEYSYLNSGTFLMQLDVSSHDIFKEICSDVSIIRQDGIRADDSLAGRIAEEYQLNQDLVKKYDDLMYDYFIFYLQECVKWKLDSEALDHDQVNSIKNYDVIAKNFWVNFQKSYEYNPLHSHNDDLSFVLYVDVPEQIYRERDDFKPKSPFPGQISFHESMYTLRRLNGSVKETILSPMFDHNLSPKTGTLLIFPAHLPHEVSAFTSNVERITMSGNASVKIELNQ